MLLITENTKWMSHLKIILTVLFSTEQVGGFMHTMYELSWWQTEMPIVSLSSSANFKKTRVSQKHTKQATSKVQISKYL